MSEISAVGIEYGGNVRRVRLDPKVVFDRTAAVILLTFLSPLMGALALLVKTDGGAAIFGHTRIGRDGRPFKCLKFRTMCENNEAILASYLEENPQARAEWETQRKLTADPRVTWIGRILRTTSLDELPQFVNVLRGEMSIVGPRPVTDDELRRQYRHRARHYFECTPGITGLWQVSGRSQTTYRRRVAIDTTYARKRTFALDMWIIARTVPAVLFSRGAQ